MADLVTKFQEQHRVLGRRRDVVLATCPKECKSFLFWKWAYTLSLHVFFTLPLVNAVAVITTQVAIGPVEHRPLIHIFVIVIGLCHIVCSIMHKKRHYDLCLEFFNPHVLVIERE